MLKIPRNLIFGSHHQHTHTHLYFLHTTLHTTNSSCLHQTLRSLVEKCLSISHLKTLHAQIILQGLTHCTLTVSKLISFCALSPSGDLQYARLLFDKTPEPNRHMYNTLIRAYASSKHPEKAILLYHQIVYSGIFPNEFTFPFTLKACANLQAYREGLLVLVHIMKLGFFKSHTCVQNGLINFFVVCGKIECAQQIFDGIEARTIVSWNSLIHGYSKMGCWKQALLLFCGMREGGFEPDDRTLVSLLSVCSGNYDLELGRFLHWYIEITGVHFDVYVHNALLDMYAKCGRLQTAGAVFNRIIDKNVVSWTSMVSAYAKHGFVKFAKNVFDQMPVKNVVSWNSMISCFLQNGYYREALDSFPKMCNSGMLPDETTIISVLSACSQLGDLATGRKFHDYVLDNIMKPTVTLYNALIDMYAKCGSTEKALDVFLEMPEKNIVTWNAIISALALHGCGFRSIELFEEMEAAGVHPDAVTFTGLLSACCHSGLIDTGRSFFHKMIHFYKIPHDTEHYACMIDILGRGGLLEEALQLVGKMPMKPDIVIWGTLLGACRTHRNVEIAKLVLKQLLELEPYSGGLYVLMSNIFCEAERWEDMKKIRKLMKDHGVRKSDAVTSIEIGGRISDFMVDDKRNEASDVVYTVLNQLTDHLKSKGCVLQWNS
ncbi:Pentatricopeptide repeat-containing protein [Abeliophyllum distichum]|uniref:Pentatricopeptide repeat-containing protein n=1 Tax=Abeliophyllum distichum TaxID=126358 RepID=A0ABD1TFE4_9LAMI